MHLQKHMRSETSAVLLSESQGSAGSPCRCAHASDLHALACGASGAAFSFLHSIGLAPVFSTHSAGELQDGNIYNEHLAYQSIDVLQTGAFSQVNRGLLNHTLSTRQPQMIRMSKMTAESQLTSTLTFGPSCSAVAFPSCCDTWNLSGAGAGEVASATVRLRPCTSLVSFSLSLILCIQRAAFARCLLLWLSIPRLRGLRTVPIDIQGQWDIAMRIGNRRA